MRRAILIALLATGCSSQHVDPHPPGSTTHETYVVVNDLPKLPNAQAYMDTADARANALAAQKCGSMRVEEVSRVRHSGFNSVLLTFRCQP